MQAVEATGMREDKTAGFDVGTGHETASIPVVGLLASLALIVGACGGSSGTTGTQPTTAS
jgi:hypothetical protein